MPYLGFVLVVRAMNHEEDSAVKASLVAYLKTISQKKETLSFKKMALTQWDGNPEHFKTMLHQRGINRLAKSLYGESSSLLWHLAHRLDIERANILQKLCKPLDHPQAVGVLRAQVSELIQSLKTSNPT